MARTLTLILLAMVLVAKVHGDSVQRIRTFTSSCLGCGMSAGDISIKVRTPRCRIQKRAWCWRLNWNYKGLWQRGLLPLHEVGQWQHQLHFWTDRRVWRSCYLKRVWQLPGKSLTCVKWCSLIATVILPDWKQGAGTDSDFTHSWRLRWSDPGCGRDWHWREDRAVSDWI